MSYETIEAWFDRWDQHGREGLADIERIGRLPKLDADDRNILREVAEEHPQEPYVMLE